MKWKKESTIAIIVMFVIMNSSGCIGVFKDKSEKKITCLDAYDLLRKEVDTNALMLVRINCEGINNNGLAESWSFTFREKVNDSIEYVVWNVHSNSTIIESILSSDYYAYYDGNIYNIGLDSDVLVKKSRELQVFKNFSENKNNKRVYLVHLSYCPEEEDGLCVVLLTYEARWYFGLDVHRTIYIYLISRDGKLLYYE
ncbi:MAG: hypothetical protein MUC62_08830 [Candidatus Thermoplasmatota archaeon]|nr:hypothetical protein [Candidatus Thermoplasmatota archaeon]